MQLALTILAVVALAVAQDSTVTRTSPASTEMLRADNRESRNAHPCGHRHLDRARRHCHPPDPAPCQHREAGARARKGEPVPAARHCRRVARRRWCARRCAHGRLLLLLPSPSPTPSRPKVGRWRRLFCTADIDTAAADCTSACADYDPATTHTNSDAAGARARYARVVQGAERMGVCKQARTAAARDGVPGPEDGHPEYG